MGDIPDAEIKPLDNVLFVRPINPVTQVSIIPNCLPLGYFVGAFWWNYSMFLQLLFLEMLFSPSVLGVLMIILDTETELIKSMSSMLTILLNNFNSFEG